jgi:HlyD family secretion protein
VGQTVAASFQAPVLFIIANDLASMQVNAAVDEADIGRVRTGQEVSFRVDAYPDRTFAGKIEQVRLQPQTIQNVVSYNTIISADNAEQRLMPGMTATVSIVVNKAENALRLPASALRFRPEGFEDTGGRSGARPAGSRGAEGAPAAGGAAVSAVQAASREGGRADGGRADGASGGRGPRGPSEGKRSLVFLLGADQKPEPTRVQTGLSDGQFVEVKEGLTEGAVVVTGLEGAGGRGPGGRPGTSPSNNPFAPGPPPRRQR